MTGNVRQTAPELTWGTLRVTCDNSPTDDGTGPQKAPEGTEDMKSIDNLREYALTAPSICSTTRAILVGYIDGIDREVDDMWHALTIDAKPMTDENMAADGWVRLPVDADGVPIHVGDVLEWRYGNGEFEVVGIGGNTLFYIDKDSNECEWTEAGDKHHHHVPTVEDVLLEMLYKAHIYDRQEMELIPDLIAEYAAKLRLAGDE